MLEDSEVRLVPRSRDVARLDAGADGAVGFMAVAAVGEAAARGVGSEVGEVGGKLFGGEPPEAELADTGGVDDADAAIEPVEARAGGGVAAEAVGELPGRCLQLRAQGVQER